MRSGSLFSGYAGLDMAVDAVFGTRTAWHAEIDPAASKVLKHRRPFVPNLGDITAIDWDDVEPVDVITAGWPCQPFSLAGKRKGSADDRALWPYVARAVRMVRPRLVFLENVGAIVTAGELGRAVAALAALGYVGSWTCLRASDVGAPHRRERCFIVAQDADHAVGGQRWVAAPGQAEGGRARADAGRRGRASTADTERGRRDGRTPDQEREQVERATTARGSQVDWGPYEPAIRRWEHTTGRPAPAPTEPGRNGPRLAPRFVEWMMGLPAGWVTDVPGITRNDQLRMLGNGVVPQQAVAALQMLLAAEREAVA